MYARTIAWSGLVSAALIGFLEGAAQGADNSGVDLPTGRTIHEGDIDPSQSKRVIGPTVPKQPPALIEEIPPLESPADAVWLPGYWAWNDVLDNFVWVSGCWRECVPNAVWMPGSWQKTSAGWQWASGYWSTGEVQTPLTLAAAIVNNDICFDWYSDFPLIRRPIGPVRPAVSVYTPAVPFARAAALHLIDQEISKLTVRIFQEPPALPSASSATPAHSVAAVPPTASLAKPKAKKASKLAKIFTHHASSAKTTNPSREEALMVQEASKFLPQSSRQAAPALLLEPAAEPRVTPAHAAANLSRDFDRTGSEPHRVEPRERPSSRSESHGSAAAPASSKAAEKK